MIFLKNWANCCSNASRASTSVLPARWTAPYCRRLIVPSKATRYWPETCWMFEGRASTTETSGCARVWCRWRSMARAACSICHPAHADQAVSGTQVHPPLRVHQIDGVDRHFRRGPEHGDLQQIEALDVVGRQRDKLGNFDWDNVGRFDAVGRERDLGQLPGRFNPRKRRAVERGVVVVKRPAAGQARQAEENCCESESGASLAPRFGIPPLRR